MVLWIHEGINFEPKSKTDILAEKERNEMFGIKINKSQFTWCTLVIFPRKYSWNPKVYGIWFQKEDNTILLRDGNDRCTRLGIHWIWTTLKYMSKSEYSEQLGHSSRTKRHSEWG